MIKYTDLSKLSPTDLAYISGLLERAAFGISIANKKTLTFKIFIVFSFYNNDLILWLFKNIGGSYVVDKKTQEAVRWILIGESCVRLLDLCTQFIRAKKDHADILLKFGTTFKRSTNLKTHRKNLSTAEIELRMELYNKMRILNKESKTNPRRNVVSSDL